jgi:hypothetical protein
MRHLIFASVALGGLALLPNLAGAQPPRPKVHIDNVQVGFPAVPEQGDPYIDERNRITYHKAGFWAPVYVDLSAGPDGFDDGFVVVESADSNDDLNNYTVQLPRGGIGPNEMLRVLTYTKPGSVTGEVSVTVHRNETPNRISSEFKKSFDAIGPGDALVMAVGSRLTGLRLSLFAVNNQANPYDKNRFVYVVDDVRMLPDHWFGYGAVDLLVLTTGNKDFMTSLLNERINRKEALAEWVRRGGRLVLSCGRNQDMAAQLLTRMSTTLPVSITGSIQRDRLDAVETWVSGTGVQALVNPPPRSDPQGKPPPIDLAKLELSVPGQVEMLVPPRREERSPTLVARMPYGLGQVMMIGFDVDTPPFLGWGGQGEFWKKVQQVTRTRPSDFGLTGNQPNQMGYAGYDTDNDLATGLEKNLEKFDAVSVISFGWVALFIFLYIIVVGPLDYLFLKKVVKRLELTWITFPTVVLVVSAAAYFAAYSLKGHDLRINKIDLVDVDAEAGEVYGHTWFTLFSPRIQLYTVGIEPTSPGWVAETEADRKRASVVVSWLGRPEGGYGGYARPRSQSFFRKTYEYARDAEGLLGVPIQVWSTKAFTASWDRPVAPNTKLFTAELRRQSGGQGVEGTITSHLPGVLEDAAIIYGEGQIDPKLKVLTLGTLEPGAASVVKPDPSRSSKDLSQWIIESGVIQRARGQVVIGSNQGLLKRILFHDTGNTGDNLKNTAFHHLEQSWRPAHLNEVILFGRLISESGSAEETALDPRTPSRLWLDKLPGKEKRPELVGTMNQETYVRAFVPLR